MSLETSYRCALIHMCLDTAVVSDESGLLVHCISGWDRTPLFVSLLRLSLWAVSSYFFFSLSSLYILSTTSIDPAAHLAPRTFICQHVYRHIHILIIL